MLLKAITTKTKNNSKNTLVSKVKKTMISNLSNTMKVGTKTPLRRCLHLMKQGEKMKEETFFSLKIRKGIFKSSRTRKLSATISQKGITIKCESKF